MAKKVIKKRRLSTLERTGMTITDVYGLIYEAIGYTRAYFVRDERIIGSEEEKLRIYDGLLDVLSMLLDDEIVIKVCDESDI